MAKRIDWRRVIQAAFPDWWIFFQPYRYLRGDGYAARRRQGVEILYQPDPAILLKLLAERDRRQPPRSKEELATACAWPAHALWTCRQVEARREGWEVFFMLSLRVLPSQLDAGTLTTEPGCPYWLAHQRGEPTIRTAQTPQRLLAEIPANPGWRQNAGS
jgi:hypothetical protein